MTAPPDSRWQHKKANFDRALSALVQSLVSPVTEARDVSGIVKDFEIVYELSWKCLKAVLEKQGHESGTARDVFARAYQLRLLDDEAAWLEMIEDRNLAVHTDDEKLAQALCDRIRSRYVTAFQQLQKTLHA